MASKTLRWAHFMMLFPLRGTHLSEFVFQHPGLNWGSLGGKLTIFRPKTDSNKGQLTNLVEAFCHQFREHDEEELKKLDEWQRRVRVRACCSSVRPPFVRSPTNKRRPPNEGWTEKRRLLNETLSRRKRWWTQMGWRGDGFFSHELPRIIHEWLARVLMSRRKRGKRRKVWAS